MSNFDDIFESAPQTDEFDKEAWAAKKKAERDELYALADATAEAVCADGGKFREYLDVQAAFRNYSATNALLILATKPDARRLGDKDFWRDQGVYMRQFVFSVLAILVAVGLYFLLKPHFGTETVSWMCILGAAPFAALGFITYHGMTAEQFLWAWLRSELLEPKELRFEASNLYYEALKDKLEGGKS